MRLTLPIRQALTLTLHLDGQEIHVIAIVRSVAAGRDDHGGEATTIQLPQPLTSLGREIPPS